LAAAPGSALSAASGYGAPRYSATVEVVTSQWSGEGDFTAVLLEVLRVLPLFDALRIEDAPASRADAGYAFISNEIYVRFRQEARRERGRWLGVVPVSRTVQVPVATLAGLEARLTDVPGVGAPDYSDDGLLQYLRAERVVFPYQTKGIKVVELVRIYALGA
jgi:hypothetical protein